MNAHDVNDIIDALANRLAVPAAHLWAVLIRQAYVEFAIAAGAMLVALVLFLVAFAWFWRSPKGWAASDAPAFAAVFTGVLLGMTVIGVLTTVGGALNPEYYAIHEILGAIKR